MAYTKTPSQQTQDTKRLSFLYPPEQRSGTIFNKDAKLVNVMVDFLESPDKSMTKVFVKKRPGLVASASTVAGTARGIYSWLVSGTTYILSVVGTGVYTTVAGSSTSTLIKTLTTSTGDVGFTEYVASTGVVSLILLDGTKGYVFSSPTLAPTEITSANFPTPHIPNPIFLDGYLLVAKADTQDVYNSDLDDPTAWTAGNYMSAEMYPDKIVALTKNNFYVYTVGTSSIEYLYDAANATGSPLGRHDSAVQQFGTAAPNTVVSTDNEVVLIGSTDNGGYTVWSIDGFKAKEIGTSPVRSIISAEANQLSSAKGHVIRVAGQKLYIINLSSVSLVYSFDSQLWTYWTSNDGAFFGQHSCDGPNGKVYCLDPTDGTIYTLSEDVFDDDGYIISVQVVTPKFDFDSMNRKFMSRFSLIGDWDDVTGNVVSIEFSDDDYATWSTARNLPLSGWFPVLTQLGVFRRRAFRISYSQPYRLRLEGMEVDINQGIQ